MANNFTAPLCLIQVQATSQSFVSGCSFSRPETIEILAFFYLFALLRFTDLQVEYSILSIELLKFYDVLANTCISLNVLLYHMFSSLQFTRTPFPPLPLDYIQVCLLFHCHTNMIISNLMQTLQLI